jgi:hypothetical protein
MMDALAKADALLTPNTAVQPPAPTVELENNERPCGRGSAATEG